jgi:hypothetical protein
MNNSSEALRHYNESLSIYRLHYRPDHEDVKRGEADIRRLNNGQSPPSAEELEQE